MFYFLVFFFFNNSATTEIYTYLPTLSRHDALPISGKAASAPLAKSKHEVMSPQTERCHGLIAGMVMPKRCSRNWPTEVWSKTSLLTQPPEIGRAHVCTPVTNAHLVCRLLLERKKQHQIKTMTIPGLHDI